MEYKNFYEVLEVREDASAREIRDAYIKKAKEWHSDVNPNKDFKLCHQTMCAINEAYRYLISPELRKLQDEVLAERRKETYKKATSKRQTKNTSHPTTNISKKDFNYYDLDDYDDDEKENFVSWLNEYYWQLINILTGFISLEDLSKLVQGFESIINYEKTLLQSRKRRYKNL